MWFFQTRRRQTSQLIGNSHEVRAPLNPPEDPQILDSKTSCLQKLFQKLFSLNQDRFYLVPGAIERSNLTAAIHFLSNQFFISLRYTTAICLLHWLLSCKASLKECESPKHIPFFILQLIIGISVFIFQIISGAAVFHHAIKIRDFALELHVIFEKDYLQPLSSDRSLAEPPIEAALSQVLGVDLIDFLTRYFALFKKKNCCLVVTRMVHLAPVLFVTFAVSFVGNYLLRFVSILVYSDLEHTDHDAITLDVISSLCIVFAALVTSFYTLMYDSLHASNQALRWQIDIEIACFVKIALLDVPLNAPIKENLMGFLKRNEDQTKVLCPQTFKRLILFSQTNFSSSDNGASSQGDYAPNGLLATEQTNLS